MPSEVEYRLAFRNNITSEHYFLPLTIGLARQNDVSWCQRPELQVMIAKTC